MFITGGAAVYLLSDGGDGKILRERVHNAQSQLDDAAANTLSEEQYTSMRSAIDSVAAVVPETPDLSELPKVSDYVDLPNLPKLSDYVDLPQMPKLPEVHLPSIPKLPEVRIPQLPEMPDLPKVQLPKMPQFPFGRKTETQEAPEEQAAKSRQYGSTFCHTCSGPRIWYLADKFRMKRRITPHPDPPRDDQP